MIKSALMLLARHKSPDGTLTLIAELVGDDLQIGFEGMPWHTHTATLSLSLPVWENGLQPSAL
jgi:hypothetical protein